MSRIAESVRLAVRRRANGRCEYCRRPEETSPFSYNVDHIVSQKHGGSSRLDNLAWACVDCNISKGPDVAAYDQETGLLAALYDPRNQEWNAHFVMEEGVIRGLTPVGRATARLLDFNDPDRLEARGKLVALGLW